MSTDFIYSPLDSPLKHDKYGLGWTEWLKGWFCVITETLIQRITSIHLRNPLPLPPLNGLNCIVTGATSGIGLEIARQLACSGANVVMAVRNTTSARQLVKTWQTESSMTLYVEVMELNLLHLYSVVKFSEKWNSLSKPLHILVNNAGIFTMRKPQAFTDDGYEIHLQVNHLAPALLSILLLPSLKKGAPSRIVNVNSIMHMVGFVDASDMNFISKRNIFTSLRGYSSSKLAQVMFCSVLQKHIPAGCGVSIVCVDPGSVRTNVVRDLPRVIQCAFHMVPYFFFSPQEGSRSALYGATNPEILRYCSKLKAEEWPVCAYVGYNCSLISPANEAYNIKVSKLVWKKTMEMVGLPSNAVDILLEDKQLHCRYGAHIYY